MAKIGDYRLKIYELFYEKPICNYKETEEQNILILGNGWAGNEAFKASFWAGQSLNSQLNITIASQNALEYEKQVLSNEQGAVLPALSLYVREKHYANLRFMNINIKDGVDEAGLAPLNLGKNRYNYVIVALGDAEYNWLAASELVTQISSVREKSELYNGKIIINVFNEFSASIETDDQESLIQYGKDNGIEVHFFGEETRSTGTELDRLARNINFSYEMKYNQRISKIAADERFEKSKMAEFVHSPFDYERGDLEIVSNFVGGEYNADSSFAFAVHIPVKLAACREMFPERDPMIVLREAVQEKNDLYWKLVSLEHRRWNAYVVMRGFRTPNVKEEKTLLYHNGNTHQDKQRLLHMSLCECGRKGVLKNNFDQQYRMWLKKKCPKDFPSELDRASLRAHQLVSRLSKQINISQLLDSIPGDNLEYVNLRWAVRKLSNDEDNSLVLYQKALTAAITYAQSVSSEEYERIKSINHTLKPIKIRNARIDFFSLDEQLVEMIPFVLWYGIKYRTVVTISDGMSTATHDVIIPTLFCAHKAIFIGKAVENIKYQKAVRDYFKNRGSNTEAQFLAVPSMDIQSVYDCLEEQIQMYGVNDLVINCVPNRNYDILLAIGRILEKYSGKIHVVRYLPNKGVITFSKDTTIGVGLDNKSFSLSEYIRLMGARVSNEYENVYDNNQFESLCCLFQNFSQTRKLKNGKKGTENFNPWVRITKWFEQIAKDGCFEDILDLNAEGELQHYHGEFLKNVFWRSKIGQTVKELQKYHIICDYKEEFRGFVVEMDFDYVNPELQSLLSIFEYGKMEEKDDFKTIRFSPLSGGLKISNRRIRDAYLFIKGEREEQITIKKNFMNELMAKGFISNLTISPDGRISFVFKDEATMQLFRSQGTAFELIVYYLMKESGLFDDVETGVKIAWNTEDIYLKEILMQELHEKNSEILGYGTYKKTRQEILRRPSVRRTQAVKNEIDVIGISGMNAVMISCKTSDKDDKQWIYEIKSVAEHFLSTGVMAIASDCRGNNKITLKERAKQMKIAVWGTETLWDSKSFRKALKNVVRQRR